MTRRTSRLEWLPPLLVGASAAVAAEVAMSVLLYGGTGFVRSLTTVLAVEGLAFAGGLWSASTSASGLVDRLRRRWVLCLLAFIAAAVFGTVWSFMPEVGESRLGQGAGLALLGGLPLYGAGAVLGGMSVLAMTDPGERLAAPGSAAAAGAALGFVLTGFFLPRAPVPASLLVICLVMLSLGGMIYGVVLGARTEVDLLATRPGRGTDVVVEKVTLPLEEVAIRRLREGHAVRRVAPLDDRAVFVPWDVAVVRALLPHDHDGDAEAGRAAARGPWRVLLVGGGASALPRVVLREHPTAEVLVLERAAAVVELGREHFDTELSVGSSDRCAVRVGNLDDAIAACDGSYDLILVDSAALDPIGGAVGLSRMVRRRLPALIAAQGALVWGPDASDLVLPDSAAGWSMDGYRRVMRRPLTGAPESLAMIRRSGESDEVVAVPDFKQVSAP